MSKNKTTEEFNIEASLVHNNKYDYSLVDYKNSKTKVKIICPNHGIFEQLPFVHLRGFGCTNCSNEKMSKHFRNDKSEIIKRFNIIHNNFYDYSLMDYKNNKTKIKIICPIHGIFEQVSKSHLKGIGCSKCYYYNLSNKLTDNNQDFILKSQHKHNYFYDYSLVDYINCRTKVKIICPIHGIFEQLPYIHTQGAGCPICNESKGEKEIRFILDNNNINYIKQKTFIDCKYKSLLKFDFYLTDYNICIEFDGEQHYIPKEKFGGKTALKIQQIKDKIKDNYCIKNNIQLIRIKYNENINEKLKLHPTPSLSSK